METTPLTRRDNLSNADTYHYSGERSEPIGTICIVPSSRFINVYAESVIIKHTTALVSGTQTPRKSLYVGSGYPRLPPPQFSRLGTWCPAFVCVCVCVWWFVKFFCIWVEGLCVVVWQGNKWGGGGGGGSLGSFSSFFI